MTVADVLRQIIEQALFNATITSAGGESPRINRVTAVDINVSDFENILESEIERLIEESRELTTTSPDAKDPKSLGFMDLLSAGRTGGRGPEAVMGMLQGYIPHIAAALLAYGFARQISDFIFSAGGPGDLRYRRDIPREVENYLTRQQQRDTQIGKRHLIIQAQGGFLNLQGMGNSNTMRQVKESVGGHRLADIGLNERAYGQYWRTS